MTKRWLIERLVVTLVEADTEDEAKEVAQRLSPQEWAIAKDNSDKAWLALLQPKVKDDPQDGD